MAVLRWVKSSPPVLRLNVVVCEELEGTPPMCLAVPAEVIRLEEGERAVVSLGGIRKSVSVALVPDVVPGDYVILHVGYALSKIDEAEARRTLDLLAAEGAVAEVLAEMREGEEAVR
jgi:hydrogenase expression/formation protein HypC